MVSPKTCYLATSIYSPNCRSCIFLHVFSHKEHWNQVFFGQCWGLERDLVSPGSQKLPLLASQLESLLSRRHLYRKTKRAGVHNADPQRKRVSRPRGIPGRLVTAPGLPRSGSDEPAHRTDFGSDPTLRRPFGGLENGVEFGENLGAGRQGTPIHLIQVLLVCDCGQGVKEWTLGGRELLNLKH